MLTDRHSGVDFIDTQWKVNFMHHFWHTNNPLGGGLRSSLTWGGPASPLRGGSAVPVATAAGEVTRVQDAGA